MQTAVKLFENMINTRGSILEVSFALLVDKVSHFCRIFNDEQQTQR